LFIDRTIRLEKFFKSGITLLFICILIKKCDTKNSVKKNGEIVKKTLICILVIVAVCSCRRPESIAPSVLGGKKYDSARAIIITKNNFALAGMTESTGLGGVDVYMLLTDKNGRIKSQNTYGGKGDDRAFTAVKSSDKGYMLAGYTTSYGAGNTDVYLVKTGPTGKYVSAKVFGGKGFDEARGICADGTGGYIIAGNSNSFGNGDYDAYVIRVDSEGNCVWAKTFGGTGNERIHSVTPAGKNMFLVAGSSNSKNNKLHDCYVLFVDLNGRLTGEYYYGGEFADSAYSAVMTNDGNFVLACEKGSKESGADILIIKIDSVGKVIWEKTYGGVLGDYPAEIIETKDGGLAVAAVTESRGSGMSDILIMKTDKDGSLLWDKVLGGKEDEYAGGIAEDSDAGLVCAGWTRSYGTGDYDMYLIKTDKNGTIKK
jgi:hypothetical protein